MTDTTQITPVNGAKLEETEKPLTRDQIRASIFKSREQKREPLTFQGIKLELIQPRLADIVAAENVETQAAVVRYLIQYAVVPGTTEKVFDDADADAFLQIPFDDNFTEVIRAYGRLTGVNFPSLVPGSSETP